MGFLKALSEQKYHISSCALASYLTDIEGDFVLADRFCRTALQDGYFPALAPLARALNSPEQPEKKRDPEQAFHMNLMGVKMGVLDCFPPLAEAYLCGTVVSLDADFSVLTCDVILLCGKS